METTQFRIRLPGGDYLLDEHGEVAVYTMGGKPDGRIADLEAKVGGTAVDIMTRADIARLGSYAPPGEAEVEPPPPEVAANLPASARRRKKK